MKELLEKFATSDLFAHGCPGTILLLSFTLWLRPDFASPAWKHQVLVALVILVAAYAAGLVIASVNDGIMARSALWETNPPPTPAPPTWNGGPRLHSILSARAGPTLRALLAALRNACTVSLAPVVADDLVDEATDRISLDQEQMSGLVGFTRRHHGWDWLPVYRTLKARSTGDRTSC